MRQKPQSPKPSPTVVDAARIVADHARRTATNYSPEEQEARVLCVLAFLTGALALPSGLGGDRSEGRPTDAVQLLELLDRIGASVSMRPATAPVPADAPGGEARPGPRGW